MNAHRLAFLLGLALLVSFAAESCGGSVVVVDAGSRTPALDAGDDGSSGNGPDPTSSGAPAGGSSSGYVGAGSSSSGLVSGSSGSPGSPCGTSIVDYMPAGTPPCWPCTRDACAALAAACSTDCTCNGAVSQSLLCVASGGGTIDPSCFLPYQGLIQTDPAFGGFFSCLVQAESQCCVNGLMLRDASAD